MKFVLILSAIVTVCIAEAPLSGPYPPSGWKPQGRSFNLPSEYGPPPEIRAQPAATDIEITQENIEFAGTIDETTTFSYPGNAYLPPDDVDITTTELPLEDPTPEEDNTLRVQGLPKQGQTTALPNSVAYYRLQQQQNRQVNARLQQASQRQQQQQQQSSQRIREFSDFGLQAKQRENNRNSRLRVQPNNNFNQQQQFGQLQVQQLPRFNAQPFQSRQQQPIRSSQSGRLQQQFSAQKPARQQQQQFTSQQFGRLQQQQQFNAPKFGRQQQFVQTQLIGPQKFGRQEQAPVPTQEYGPPQQPAQEYGPPQEPEQPDVEEQEPVDEQPENPETDAEPEEAKGPTVAVSNAQNGQYYLLAPDNTLQKVVFMTSQTEDDRINKGFSAQLRYSPVEPIRDPIYAYNDLGQLVRIYNRKK